MSSVASLELCKELYELGGWGHKDVERKWAIGLPRDPAVVVNVLRFDSAFVCPAYDLGYLLRKLPEWIEPEKNMPHLLTIQPNPIGRGWNALYRLSVATPTSDRRHATEIHEASTPEDAACKLAIELFKQGILTQEETTHGN